MGRQTQLDHCGEIRGGIAMSTQTSRSWSDEDHQRVRTAGSGSLHSMRMALAAVMYDKRTSDNLVPLMPALRELEFALAMANEGELHPAFKVKKKPHGGRGYTPAQRCFLEMCFCASEVLYAKGHITRKAADATVIEWGAATAERLKLSWGEDEKKRPLTERRTQLAWHTRWPDHHMHLALKHAKREGHLQWLIDTYQLWIRNFDDRQAY